MHLPTLRSRLIAWHVTSGALIVLCCAALVAIVMSEALSYQARQAMNSAARQIPALAASYDWQSASPDDIDAYFAARLAPLPVRTHTEPFPGIQHFAAPRGSFREGLLVRLLMERVRPLTIAYGTARTTIFINPSFYKRFVEYYFAGMALVAVVVIVAAWRIAIVVASNSLDPLLRTTAALNRFGEGDFTPATVSTTGTSEVGELVQAYNRAVAQITRALDERAKASAEMRQFVADAGHQLRTPLTVVMGYLSAMAARGPSSEGDAVLAMLGQSRRMKTLIDELILLARLEDVAPIGETVFDLNDVVRDVPLGFSFQDQQRLHLELAGAAAPVRAAPTELREALTAVVDNALKYGGHRPITIRVRRDDGLVEITVSDDGPGFSQADLSSAFDRFYRGAASEGIVGTGLGLSIAAKAVQRAGGAIELRNQDSAGAACIIRLPTAA
ncbi:MAG TPA: HAMP domain-containing sensor histidine kinase [Candidatus Cybelea sp.]|nr:HAMP domain-containing sensor histidine kinase [Candidatus Cybelea sp.]